MNVVQSEPKFTIQITKTNFVIAPVKEKINRTVQSLLEHCPPPTVCCLVTKHIKGRQIIRFDGVHTVFSFTRFVDLGTVISCKRKQMIQILIWRVRVSFVETPKARNMNMVIRTYFCVKIHVQLRFTISTMSGI